MSRLVEAKESLWWLVVSPTIWAVHLLAAYITVAIWCAKVAYPDGPLGPARTAVVVYTVAALLGVAANAWYGRRRHKRGERIMELHKDTALGRHRFLGFASLLLSALSAVAITFAAMPLLFIWSCR